jgi:hypothetical protein
LGRDASEEQLQKLRHKFGLDVPAPQQYVNWLMGFVKGDWGRSFTGGNQQGEWSNKGFVTAHVAGHGALGDCLAQAKADVESAAMRVKQDIIPRRYTYAWFRATKPGTYRLDFDAELARWAGVDTSMQQS